MKKHRIHTSYLVVLLTVLFSMNSCWLSITGTGPVATKSRPVGNFHELTVDIPATITLVMSDSSGCVITAQENIIENIKTDESGNKLVIDSKKNYSTNKPVEIVLSTNTITAIKLNGSGNIRVLNTVKGQELNLKINGSGNIIIPVEMIETTSQINGSGDITISGSSGEHNIEINGSGSVYADQLKVDNYHIKLNGSGDAKVNASGEMDVRLIGSGNVLYRGSPTIQSKITGSGEVKKIN